MHTCSQRLKKAARCGFHLARGMLLVPHVTHWHTLCNPAYALGYFLRLFSAKWLQVNLIWGKATGGPGPQQPPGRSGPAGWQHCREQGAVRHSPGSCSPVTYRLTTAKWGAHFSTTLPAGSSFYHKGNKGISQAGTSVWHTRTAGEGVDSQMIYLSSANFSFTINECIQPIFSSYKLHSSLALPWVQQIRTPPNLKVTSALYSYSCY